MSEFVYVWVMSDLEGAVTPVVFAKRSYAQEAFALEPGVSWRRARQDGGFVTSDGRWRLTRHPVCGMSVEARKAEK